MEREERLERSHGASGATPTGVTEARLPETIGEYRVIRKIGQGGAGLVVEVVEVATATKWAIKIALSDVAPRIADALRNQGESMRAVSTQVNGIVRVTEVA